MNDAPILQRLINSLPYRSDAVAITLARVTNSRIRATVNRAKFRLDLREAIQRRMFLRAYEPAQTEWVRQCLCPGDVFVDAGASFGYYSSLASSLVGITGKVFAFEPSPVAGRVLEDAIRESPLTNVVLTRAALGSAAGDVRLYLPNTPQLHSPSVLASDPDFGRIDVPVVTLDEFVPLGNLDVKLVKMDVEGYEPNVLRGMATLLRRGRVLNIICEFNSGWLRRNASTPEQLHDMLSAHGFEVVQTTNLERSLIGHHGEQFDLQDRWYALAPGARCAS